RSVTNRAVACGIFSRARARQALVAAVHSNGTYAAFRDHALIERAHAQAAAMRAAVEIVDAIDIGMGQAGDGGIARHRLRDAGSGGPAAGARRGAIRVAGAP